MKVLVNGRTASEDLGANRALHYGDGVFRTCLINNGQVVDMDGQLEHIAGDARRLGLAVETAPLRQDAVALAQGVDLGVLKMMVWRRGPGRGYASTESAVERLLSVHPLIADPAEGALQGIRVARSTFRLATQPALAGIKHLNRLEQVLASRTGPAGMQEWLLSDAEGRPVSGTRTNLFWVDAQGRLHTPALTRCGVAGFMRSRILRASAALGQEVLVVDGAWDDVLAATEVFLTNSLVGIWPVAQLDEHRWAAPGPVTRRLMQAIGHPRSGVR